MVRGGKHDRLFVIFSHHTIGTMDQQRRARVGCSVPPCATCCCGSPTSCSGSTATRTATRVTPYTRTKNAKAPGGFWEVNTAAHVDWPQQARTVELVDNRNGTLSIFGTIVDHVAPTSYGKHPKSPAGAGVALPRAGRQRLAGARQAGGRSGRPPRTARGPQRRAAGPAPFRLSPGVPDRDLMRHGPRLRPVLRVPSRQLVPARREGVRRAPGPAPGCSPSCCATSTTWCRSSPAVVRRHPRCWPACRCST